MKKLTKYILSVLTALVLCFVASNAVYAEVYDPSKIENTYYETYSEHMRNEMMAWDINGVYYMSADLEIASPGGLDDADTSKIFTYEERIDLKINRRYACVDGILYDLVLHCENDIAITKTQCGTLQGLFNTGRYDCWDTEPVAGALDAKNPFAKPITNTITVEDYSATMYATKKANIRSNGSTDYDIIGTVKFNEEVTVTGKCSTGWYRIKYNGGDGFISNKLLTDTKYVEPEVPVIDNRLFTDLNEEAINTLNQLIEADDYDASIKVLSTAEHKIIPIATLTKIKENNKPVTVSFVREDETEEVTYTLTNVLDDKDLDLSYTLTDNVFDFGTNEVYSYKTFIKVKTSLSDNVYVHVGNEETGYVMQVMVASDNGYVSYETNAHGTYTFANEDMSIVDEPVVEEPIIEEPIIDEPVIDEPIVDEPIIDEPDGEDVETESPIVSDKDKDDFSDEILLIAIGCLLVVIIVSGYFFFIRKK